MLTWRLLNLSYQPVHITFSELHSLHSWTHCEKGIIPEPIIPASTHHFLRATFLAIPGPSVRRGSFLNPL